MKEQIKELRVKIDGLSQLTKELKPIHEGYKGEDGSKFYINSDEINKCYDSLILAKAWLGKILGELGTETPYKNDGKRKEVKDIEPTADRGKRGNLIMFEEVGDFWDSKSHIEKVDWLREEIRKANNAIIQYTQSYQIGWIAVYSLRCDKYLSEARFWLGFELDRVRDSK